MRTKSKILVFMDDEPQPFGEFEAPINIELNTLNLADGNHTLKIISKDPAGREGIREIPFIVRNGPAISVEGLKNNAVVDGVLPIMISAYGKGDEKQFLIEGSETPRSIPSWIWAAVIVFIGWAVYYLTIYL